MKRKMLALLVAACAAIACAGAAYAQTGSFGAESARANRFSAGFTALGLNLSYERDLSPMFSIGATAFGCYDFDLFVGGVMGVLAEARLSPWRFPLYFGLGLGYGMRQRTEYEGGRTPVSMQNAGFMMTPELGVRLIMPGRSMFLAMNAIFPMIIGSGGFSRDTKVLPGISAGFAW